MLMACPAMKEGKSARPGFRDCIRAPGVASGVMRFPVGSNSALSSSLNARSPGQKSRKKRKTQYLRNPDREEGVPTQRETLCLLNFAVTNAGGANLDALAGTLHYRMNGLKVEVPTALGYIVGVADAVAKLRSTTANITYFRHG